MFESYIYIKSGFENAPAVSFFLFLGPIWKSEYRNTAVLLHHDFPIRVALDSTPVSVSALLSIKFYL